MIQRNWINLSIFEGEDTGRERIERPVTTETPRALLLLHLIVVPRTVHSGCGGGLKSRWADEAEVGIASKTLVEFQRFVDLLPNLW